MNIGFIGLGNMGRAMVSNMLKAGHHVRVWNRSPGPAQEMQAQGAEWVKEPEAALNGDAVFSMLADDRALREVLLEKNLLAAAPKQLIHVNMSTISVAFAKELAAAHEKSGLRYIAAPVLGRPDVAAAAKLTILAAGPVDAIERVQPVLDVIGQKTWHAGDEPSHANVMKLAANILLASAVETLGEAAAFVSAHGVAPKDLLEVVTSSTFPGPVYQGYGKSMCESKFEPAGFKAALALKDVRLALGDADLTHTPLPLVSIVRDSLLEAVAQGDGEKDLAVLGKIAARRAGQ
jgi:3-hydroxyisobutyrate dehydrogenase-like beta-hydroxyacid dehydrogenase